jgi:Transposase IS66 family
MELPNIPESHKNAPWMESLLALVQEQARIIQEQAEQITTLKKTVQELRDEIARLKKMPNRPKFRPNGTPPNGKGKDESGKKDTTSPVRKALPPKAQEEILLKVEAVPAGSRFKGYQTYAIQELTLVPKDVIYKMELWQLPDGTLIKAPLPATVSGSHFGPGLRALIHGLYASGVTQPALFNFLQNVGIDLSEGQVHNILMGEAKGYQEESEAILTAGLQAAPYIRTDDTGAKHEHRNGYCTHIGGEYFAYYKTTASKSRINFLRILLQGKEGYIINEAFIWHLFESGVQDDILNAFETHSGKKYRTKKGLGRLLNAMGLKGKKLYLTCLEAGLVGFIQETILKPGQVLISDRAGQFLVFNHAGCWIHAERPLRKLVASTPEIEAEIGRVRQAIWNAYAKVKDASLAQMGKEEARELYDQMVAMKVTSPGVQNVLLVFRDYREEMLKALDHPGLPLHNNDSERDIRGMVKIRNVSGSTKSEEGLSFRDGLLSLKQTCFRLGVSFWEYLVSWFRREPMDLAERVRRCYQPATSVGPPNVSF